MSELVVLLSLFNVEYISSSGSIISFSVDNATTVANTTLAVTSVLQALAKAL